MSIRFLKAAAAVGLLAGCGAPSSPEENNRAAAVPPAGPSENAAMPPGNDVAEAPLDPPDAGEPGGLPDDRTPISEAPFAETSAQGAANVVQTYQGLLEAGRYGEAWRLWSDGGRASGMSEAEFAAGFGRYREYHARVGAPGEIEGAAGSLYVEVPVQIYGRLRDGRPFNMLGPMTLRRVNDVPGSTPEQRRWHIAESGIRPRP
jgi:hypothetical protein